MILCTSITTYKSMTRYKIISGELMWWIYSNLLYCRHTRRMYEIILIVLHHLYFELDLNPKCANLFLYHTYLNREGRSRISEEVFHNASASRVRVTSYVFGGHNITWWDINACKYITTCKSMTPCKQMTSCKVITKFSYRRLTYFIFCLA